MKKIRYYIAAIALVAALIGPALQGMGAGAIANAIHGQHASTSFVTGMSTRSIARASKGWCPIPGFDC